MLNKRVESELNKQINAELYSAYLYLSMSAYFENKNLKGFANWMKIQYQEETAHGIRFYNYIIDRGGSVMLDTIKGPETTWKDVIEVFEQVLKHERLVTSLIHNLMNVAIEEKDHATQTTLQWFVNEQVEEESNAEQILAELKIIEGKGQGLLMLDRELQQRVFVDPNAQPAV